MRLAATLLVRDEEQILGAHLDYHLAQGVDLFLVMDNGSIDATPEILREYERMGAVRILPGAEPGQNRQGEWVTKMARLAATEFGADWVLNLDRPTSSGGRMPARCLTRSPRSRIGTACCMRRGSTSTRFRIVRSRSGRMTVRRRVLRTPWATAVFRV